MTDYTTTPVFALLDTGTAYSIRYLTAAGVEERLDGTLIRIRVAPLNDDHSASEGVPMVGFRPRVGPPLVEVPTPGGRYLFSLAGTWQ